MPNEEQQALRQTLQRYESELLTRANVIGVGMGKIDDEWSIVVLVREKVDESALPLEDLVPAELDGFKLKVRAIGELTAHSE